MKTIEIIHTEAEETIVDRSTDVDDEKAGQELYMHRLTAELMTRDGGYAYTARIKPEDVEA